jgi:serine phosphatase RsbU (regulator of sigma subunit)
MRALHNFFGRFRIKVMLAFVSAMLVVCMLLGLLIYHYASDFALDRLRQNLVELAEISSIRVDPEMLLSIPLNPKGTESPAYKKIEHDLYLIQKTVPSIRYIYIFKKDDSRQDTLKFVVDVDTEGQEEQPAWPGDAYDASHFPELMQGFEAPSADREITKDKWGAFLSGYAPIRNKKGESIAVLGVDMMAEDVYKIQSDIKRYLAVSLAFGVMLSVLLSVLVSGGISKKVDELKKGFQRVASGELDYNVKIKGNDELSDLACFFNKMSVDLKSYIGELQKTTSEKERLLSELNIAKNIQQSFLPETMPVMPGIEIAAMTTPARVVGGDFYDFIPITANKWGIIIADVSGKGVPAALFVALSRAIIRSNTSLFDTPDMLVKHANLAMLELSRSNMFETLFYGVLDAENMILSYANAGHNPPFIWSNPEKEPVLLSAQTFPIGINPDMQVKTRVQEIKKGDVITLYTDGVTESMNALCQEYGTERLTQILHENINMSSNNIINKIQQDIELFVAGADQHDDITMVVIKAT